MPNLDKDNTRKENKTYLTYEHKCKKPNWNTKKMIPSNI